MSDTDNNYYSVFIITCIAIVGIYWYYSQRADKRLEAMFSETLPAPGVASSNGTSPPHSPQHEGVTLFPKEDGTPNG